MPRHEKSTIGATMLLAKVAIAQELFWDAIHELEAEISVELDWTRDYTGYSEPTIDDIDDLIENESEGWE